MLNCKFRSYIKPWWYVLHEKFRFYNNNKIILVYKIGLYLFIILWWESFYYKCKLVIFFSPLKCHFWTLPTHLCTVAKKIILNDRLVFKIFVFFFGDIGDLLKKKLCLRLLFLHRNVKWKSIVWNSSFITCHFRNCMKLFWNSQLFVANHNLY